VRRLAVVLAILAATLLPGVPAWAHATLQEATPSDTAVVAAPPAEVALRYDEPVSTALGAVKVLAPDGSRVDAGAVTARDGGRTVVAALNPALPAGVVVLLLLDPRFRGTRSIRVEVHQATDMVAAALDVPPQDAFARLRAHAFAHGRPLDRVARDVVEQRLVFTPDME
jgi:methionine-rich copper-binding protein CopC